MAYLEIVYDVLNVNIDPHCMTWDTRDVDEDVVPHDVCKVGRPYELEVMNEVKDLSRVVV